MIKEFKDFAMKGSVVDLAVGVVIGSAFGRIVESLVKDIIMPPIGFLLGGVDFADKMIVLKSATGDSPAITLNYGLFINAIVSFLIISFAIFIVIKQLNRFKKKDLVVEATEIKPEITSEEILLLREIRDNLRK
jgi:large conductance mechanosensitive channel